MPYADPQRRKEYAMELYYKDYEKNKANRNRTARARRNENQIWLDSLKSGPCTDCGETFPPVCMDWDHVRGTKVKNVGRLTHISRRMILEEISKCELVCANCHRTKNRKTTEGK